MAEKKKEKCQTTIAETQRSLGGKMREANVGCCPAEKPTKVAGCGRILKKDQKMLGDKM